MTTKTIGIKEFRRNLTKYARQGNGKKVRFIVMRHSIPVMKVEPLSEKELLLEKLAAEIAEAREQVKRGEVYTTEEVKRMLGL